MFDNIDFFNVDNLTKTNDGYYINRFPLELMDSLGNDVHNRGRFYAHRAIGSELRFVTDAPFFDIELKAYKENCGIYIFFGDYFYKKYELLEGISKTIHVEVPEKILKFREKLVTKGFNTNVCRIVIGYSGYVLFNGLNTFGFNCRKPNKDEVPSKTLLMYGSSISHGSEALDYINSQAFLLSKMLNCNVINKAIPGSCLAEKQMIDYLKTITCDAIFVEFGVNVLTLYKKEEYEERLTYILSELKKDKLYVTGVYPNMSEYESGIRTSNNISFNKILKNKHKEYDFNYVDPKKIVPDTSILTCDLLHPSDYGQITIANNLAKIIKL